MLIRNMIIKTCSTVRMRSLGVNMHLKGRLVGNSCLWVFSRVNSDQGDIQPCKPICIIRKMVDTQRVFCVFGHKSPSVQVQADAGDEFIMEEKNNGVGVPLNSMNSASFRQLSAKASDNPRISLNDPDVSIQSV